MQEVFVARQPIYNRQLEVAGYELLFRHRDVDSADIADANEATLQVIVNSFINIGLDNLVGSAPAFINVTEPLLVNDARLPMFHEQTVLEVARDVVPRPEVVAGMRRLKARGFALALDNFVYRPTYRPFLELADFVKLDVTALGPDQTARQLDALRGHHVQSVAENVESPEEFRSCQALGFAFYQGYFFCRPQTVRDKTLPANKAVVLSLLQKLHDPAQDIGDLEATLAVDVSLSYKLLRYVNSAAFGRRREVESLRDAIILVGLNTIRDWAALILLHSINMGKPRELIKIAMIRARTCEKLAERNKLAIRPQMFITGLFSVLDAVMDMPMEELLDNLTLTAPIKLALLAYEGPHGALLKQAVYYEQGRWPDLLAAGADMDLLSDAYLEALAWADANMNNLFA